MLRGNVLSRSSLNTAIPEPLPIAAVAGDIVAALRQHAVLIVAGETGSGKTTQLAKLCMQAGIDGRIAHTQPRRMAARSVATRIAEEMGCNLGQGVGYRVRFSDQSHRDDALCVMTDGLLLAEIQRDPLLRRYQALIIDEAHERSLNIDFLLGYLKKILPRRPDLHLIITSATIDTARFSRFFDDAPVIEVSGRGFPVEICYRPLKGDEDDRDRDLPQAILDTVDEAARHDPLGDILVFLPGEREIRDIHHSLQQHGLRDTEVVPLYARLSAAEQDRVFRPHSGRRIVLATNIAETSLTVPGICFVIDSGLARISRYSPRHRVQHLPIERIAQASANQRAGRCGRVAAGVCFRLYSEAEYEQRPPHTDPEIRRTHLASVILRMADMGLGSLQAFPLMQAPDARTIRDGHRLLEELQALDEHGAITPLGRQMAKIPLDPRFARMVLAAIEHQAVADVLIIVCGLSIPDPRLRPSEEQEKADACHKQWQDSASDFLTLRRLWQWFEEQQRHNTRSKMRRVCKQHYVSWLRMREWHDLHHQVKQALHGMKFSWQEESASYEAIHRSLLRGSLSLIGQQQEEGDYLGADGVRFAVMRGSGLHKKQPRCLMAGGLLELRKRYATTVARIESDWLLHEGAHLIRHHYGEPYWSKRRGQVLAQEQRSLFGLPLGKRAIRWAQHDRSAAHAVFVRDAVVAMAMQGRSPVLRRFLQDMQAWWQMIEQHIGKSRRLYRDDAEARALLWFNERLPQRICDQRGWEHWLKRHDGVLPLPTLSDIFNQPDELMEDYPDHLDVGQHRLSLRYRFEPQHAQDGVTLCVPHHVLPLLSVQQCQWLVPGLLLQAMIVLFKKLPAPQRRPLVPVPQFATACLEAMPWAEGDVYMAISRQVQRMTGMLIPPQQWLSTALPPHLIMHLEVLADDGKVLAQSDDLQDLQQRYTAQQQASSKQPPKATAHPMKQWQCGELPSSCQRQQRGRSITVFPALRDEGDHVRVHDCDTLEQAEAMMRQGLTRLFSLQLAQQVQWLQKKLPQRQALQLQAATLHEATPLHEQLAIAAIQHLFLSEPLPRSQAAFEERLEAGRGRFVAIAESLANDVLSALQWRNRLLPLLTQAKSKEKQIIADQLQAQLGQLMQTGFILSTPLLSLQRFACYLEAAHYRLEHGPRRFARDQQDEAACAALWQDYQQHLVHYPPAATQVAVQNFRWSLEELRVSLFAAHLKTRETVSVKRLKKQWQEAVHVL
jgi:ATP-dependent helicase HrpA